MPGRPHHSDKMKSCVDKLTAKGKSEADAFAICTVSLKKAGEPIFEAAASGSPEEETQLRAAAWPMEAGHVRGSQGGPSASHSDASAAHAKASAAHEAAAAAIRSKSANAAEQQSKAFAATRKAHSESMSAGFAEQFAAKAAKSYAGMAAKAETAGSAALFHEMAATYHGSAAHAHMNEPKTSPELTAAEVADDVVLQALEAGDAHFEEIRALTGKSRIEKKDGKDFLVVPVTALREGVIHAVNAKVPEFVPASVLAIAPSTWNGRPLVLGHPTYQGIPISANHPRILEERSFGQVFNSRYANKELLMEAWIDQEKLETLDAKLLQRLRDEDQVEVSVGALTRTAKSAGVHGGKKFSAVWKDILSDHLAFLPDARGACSVEMGCGTFRAAAAAEGEPMNIFDRVKALIAKAREAPAEEISEDELRVAISKTESDSDQRKALLEALRAMEPGVYDIVAMYSDRIIYPTYEGGKTCYYVRKYTGDAASGYKIDGNRTEVELVSDWQPVAAASRQMDCPECDGAGKMKTGKDCPTCDGTGQVPYAKRAAEGTPTDPPAPVPTPSASAVASAESVGDASAEVKPAPKALEHANDAAKPPCGCKSGEPMSKETREEVIKGLVESKYSGFTTGDEKMLEAASDERLEGFRVAAEARKNESEQNRAAATRELTTEDFMKVAPPEIKSLLDKTQKAETERKGFLVTELKACQSEYSEAELSNMKLEDLERLARVSGADVPPADYTARGLSRFPSKEDRAKDVYANPPNPYKLAIAKAKGEQPKAS